MASIFALSAPVTAIAADTWTVNTCADTDYLQGVIATKSGSLRFAIYNAASGDTVDLSALSCPSSKISLALGQVPIGDQFTAKDNLKIKGPTGSTLTIDASGLSCGEYCYNRIFQHYGSVGTSATLKVYDLRLTGGLDRHYHADAAGGCIYSSANVALYHVEVSSCSATSQNYKASGGGIFAKGNITLKYSVVSGNSVVGHSGTSVGGGARAEGLVSAKNSTIDGNSVTGPVVGMDESTYKYALGGGISAANITLLRSTVSNNTSNGSMAGIDAFGPVLQASANKVHVYSSTISGNHADKLVGGIYANAGEVKMFNSTIAFNTAGAGRTGTSPDFSFWSAGMHLSGLATDMTVTMQSSLLSNNQYTLAGQFDLITSSTTVNSITFDGTSANNLVRTRLLSAGTTGFPLTSQGCPLLGPLRDNGGLTQTHALLSGSTAINAGSNTKAYTEDQRGSIADVVPYPYPRESDAGADIGAYEVNHDEIVFNSSFETCADLE